MAPEIIQETPYDGQKADMWSLGIIIHAMAANQLPWTGQDDASLVKEITQGIRGFPPQMLPEVARIIASCTQLNPARRPTAAELLEVPWIAEELPFYKKVFGVGDGISVAHLRDGDVRSLPQFPPLTRSSAKMILSRPSVRVGPSDKAGTRSGRVFVNLVYQTD
jgi:serine/threonine protein kinase